MLYDVIIFVLSANLWHLLRKSSAAKVLVGTAYQPMIQRCGMANGRDCPLLNPRLWETEHERMFNAWDHISGIMPGVRCS